MSSIYYDTKVALGTRLSTMVGAPPIAWEGMNYEPDEATQYIRPTNVFGDSRQLTLGDADNGKDEMIGIYILDIFSPSGRGSKVSLQMADKIADRFRRGTMLTSNGVEVEITSISMNASVNENNGWSKQSITVVYSVITVART